MAKSVRRKIPEFKFANDSDIIRRKFLSKINSFNVRIGVLAISKDSVKSNLANDTNRLYNYAVINSTMQVIVDEYLVKLDPYNKIFFIIDRSLSPKNRKSFNEYDIS